MKNQMKLIAIILVVIICGMGCEIATNPLILDGVNLKASINIDSPISFFPPQTVILHLNDILPSDQDIVDSIDFYNITFLFECDSLNQATAFSASTFINGDTLLIFNNSNFSEFSSERSIFQHPLPPGVSFSSAGIHELRRALNNASTSPNATFTFSGSANGNPLHFAMQVKIYTQLYTSP